MRLEPFDLGPFELHAIVGSGGMGQVWRGIHKARGIPVGVKVVRPQNGGPRRYTLAFRNEVRQVAKLDHPHIIRILDHGETDAAAEDRSAGRIAAGAPWFAMELASGGSLAQHIDLPPDWPTAHETLVALLEGLAHAHARGVLHRDISPRNVLVAGPTDPRPGLKLADFGLARGELASDMLVDGGTPQYMSPEQFEGQIRAQGPWSDLYALGCLAWELVTGAPPFVGRTARDLHRLHTAAPPPPLVARLDVPEGLESWLLRLIQKAPSDRFRFAADALRALHALGPPVSPLVPAAPGSAANRTAELSGPLSDWSEAAEEEIHPAPSVPVRIDDREPARPTGARHPLSGVGLGLYDLRTLPLIDRQQPGDELWVALREVWRTKRPRAVVLRGATGHGKTHLARWIGWQAQEQCGAELLTVEHSPLRGPTHGLQYAIAAAIGVVGVEADELFNHLSAFLEARDVDAELVSYARSALTRYLSGDATIPVAERDALLLRFFGWISRDRPLVVRLEGLQWGHETARFARALLQSTDPLPVLVLATVDSPECEDPPLSALPNVAEIEVGPLASEDQHALVRELLTLEPALAERVVRRTRGSPLFAERLIGDWVRRGALSATAAGFALPPGADPVLPDDLHQLWIDAVEQALSGLGDGARVALEACSALGLELDRDEWTDVARRLGVEDADRIVDEVADALCARHLAEPQVPGRSGVSWPPGGAGEPGPRCWVLSHPLVWETLRRTVREPADGRWERLNRAVADMVAATDRDPGRLGLHLLAAGALEECLPPLLAGADRAVQTGALQSAGALLDRRDQAMATLAVAPADPRWGDGRIVRLRTLVGRGAFDEAVAAAQALAEDARRMGWSVLPEALRYLGLSQLKLGRLLESEAMLILAETSASSIGTDAARLTMARCEMLRGTLLRIRGMLPEALAALEASCARFEAAGDTVGVADCTSEIGHTRLTLAGDVDAAEDAIERAKDLYATIGSQVGVATCVNTLGDIHRRRGDLAAAEAAYHWAMVRFESDRIGRTALPPPQPRHGAAAARRHRRGRSTLRRRPAPHRPRRPRRPPRRRPRLPPPGRRAPRRLGGLGSRHRRARRAIRGGGRRSRLRARPGRFASLRTRGRGSVRRRRGPRRSLRGWLRRERSADRRALCGVVVRSPGEQRGRRPNEMRSGSFRRGRRTIFVVGAGSSCDHRALCGVVVRSSGSVRGRRTIIGLCAGSSCDHRALYGAGVRSSGFVRGRRAIIGRTAGPACE